MEMLSSSSDVTRGHEYYLMHILLLEQASSIALKAIIKGKEKKCGKDFGILLNENKLTIKTHYETEYLELFQDDNVNDNIDTWDTLQLCAVTLVLFKSDLTETEVKAIQFIYDQRKDIENYVECASLTYNTYKEKQFLLKEQLHELIKVIDGKSDYKCKRMMVSFETKSLQLSQPQIGKLTRTNDFKTHFKIAMEEDIVSVNDINVEDNDQRGQTNENQVFIKELQDRNVYIMDSAVLTCKLKFPAHKNVIWLKDSKPVDTTDNLMLFSNNCTNWLAIEHTTMDDTGRYACQCGSISTSAELTVIDEKLIVVVDLPIKLEVVERKHIKMECKVNLLTGKPVWRHNEKVLHSSDKYSILQNGKLHTLTVTDATFQDEGDYTADFGKVYTKTTVHVQGNTDLLHKKQLIGVLYRNWVRGALALKYLKIGLEAFSDNAIRSHSFDIMATLGYKCNTCTEESLLPHIEKQCPRQKKRQCLCSKNKKQKSRQVCPNGGFCGKVYDRIVLDHRFQDPLLANTAIQKWSSDPWSVATCFINTPGYKGKQSAKEVDCIGLLSLCINNIFIEQMLGEVTIDGTSDAFSMARDARNDILHNPNYELSEDQLNKYVKLFKEVLEIKDRHGNTPLKEEPGVEDALYLLDKVRQNQIEINLEHEIKQLKEHGMHILNETCQKAKAQHELKLQKIEKQIKEKQAVSNSNQGLQRHSSTPDVAAMHFSSTSVENQEHVKFLEGRVKNLEEELHKLKSQQSVPLEIQAPPNVNQEIPRQISIPDTNVLTEELGDNMNVQKHYPELIRSIDTLPLCDHLYSKGILTDGQMDAIQALVRRQDHNDGNRELLKILKTKRPEKAVMIEVLDATQQQHLLKWFYPGP